MMKLLKKMFFIIGLAITPTLFTLSGPIKGGPGDPMFQMPTPEEMQQIEEFLNTLTPEEIDQLAQLGEQIIKDAEKEGRPLFADMPVPVMEKPIEKTLPKTPTEAPVVTTTDKIKSENTYKNQKLLHTALLSLIESIGILRQKTSIDEIYSRILSPIDNDLDLFVYYLHVLKDSKHLVNITEEEFATLKKTIITLELDLKSMISNLEIPSIITLNNMNRKEREIRRKAIRKAEHIIHECKNILEKAFTENSFIKECEKLLKKYEPEALKIKEEQNKKTQIAGSQNTRLPVTNTGRIVQGPTFNTKTLHYTPPTRGSSVGTTIASSYDQDGKFNGISSFDTSHKNSSNNKQQTKKPDKSSPESEKASEGKQSPDEAQKTRTKIKENQEKMISNLKEANTIIQQKKTLINEFFDSYISNDNQNAAFEKTIHETLEDITLALENAQKNYNKCINDAKTIPGGRDLRNTKEESKKNIEMYTREVNELHDKLQILKEREVNPNKDDIFNERLEELEKNLGKLPVYKEKQEEHKKQIAHKKALEKQIINQKSNNDYNNEELQNTSENNVIIPESTTAELNTSLAPQQIND